MSFVLKNKKILMTAALVLAAGFFLYRFIMSSNSATIAVTAANGAVHDLGMYDFDNDNAFGTTSENDHRWENMSVRKEFNKNPFPLAEGCGDCARKGIPDPAEGDTHVCKCGPPSKRAIDAMGGHHMLPHMCAPCTGELDEPSQLGRWWKRRGCAAPESVGLDLRPICSRCGN